MNTPLAPRARAIGVVAWCSFLTACLATTVIFAFLDPELLRRDDGSTWTMSRHTAYALGFFFFWIVGACSAALTLFMARTERAAPDDSVK